MWLIWFYISQTSLAITSASLHQELENTILFTAVLLLDRLMMKTINNKEIITHIIKKSHSQTWYGGDH